MKILITMTIKEFLESRCFPRTRDKMKLVLEDIGLPFFYDTFMIIEKDAGAYGRG